MSYSIWTLAASNITVSGAGGSLSGGSQGDASHLIGRTITLNNAAWDEVLIADDDSAFADNDGTQRLDGARVYDGVSYADDLRVEAEYTLTVSDGTQTYTLIGFNINEPGAPNSFGTVEGLAFIGGVNGFPPIGVPLSVVSTGEGPGGTTTPAGTYAVPCFLPGTRLAVPGGWADVADLQPGDRVETRDHGPQPVLWVGRVHLGVAALQAAPDLAPVTIAAHAFGPGRPARALSVSPQHRVLVTGGTAEMLFDAPEVLVPAIALLDGKQVRQARPADGPVDYIHILFAQHEVVNSDGLPSESFHPGPQTLPGLGAAARDELFRLFPALRSDPLAYGHAARPCVPRRMAAALRARG